LAISPEDNREQVFAHWLHKDQQRPGNSLFWTGEAQISKPQSSPKDTENNNYLQLKLDF